LQAWFLAWFLAWFQDQIQRRLLPEIRYSLCDNESSFEAGSRMAATDLTHHFITAMPQLQDSLFTDSVVYLCRHDQEGTLGLIINKPLTMPLFEIFEQMGLEDERPYPATQTVLSGGPVETDKGFVLHDSPDDWKSTLELQDGLKLTTSRDILSDIAANKGPKNYLITLGCAGWGPGQLEQEIIENSWLTCPADKDILFSDDFPNMVNMVTSAMGFDMVQLTPNAGYC
jgi:putative transcriptional regulator